VFADSDGACDRELVTDGQGNFAVFLVPRSYEGTVIGAGGAQLGTLSFEAVAGQTVVASMRTPVGGACTGDDECGSGFCVDGVCCNEACGGGNPDDCQACSAQAGGEADGSCTPRAFASICRSGAGGCDVAETCDGLGSDCPADGYQPAGTTCGASGGGCEIAATCTGTSAMCPANTLAPAGTPCATATAFCEADQVCSGSSVVCPPVTLPPGLCAPVVNTTDPQVCDGAPACLELLGGLAATGGVALSFEEPWTGTLRAVATGVGCPPPTGFQVLRMGQMSSSGTYWNIDADPPITAPAPPRVKICIRYDQGTMPEGGMVEQGLQIVHGTATPPSCPSSPDAGTGPWVTLTQAQPIDTVNNVICAWTESLSPFAIIAPLDAGGPVFEVPATVVAFATGTLGVKVDYPTPPAVDAVDGPRPVTCLPVSGSNFQPGKSSVTCTASDTAGHTTTATFTVWVQYQAPTDASFFLKPIRADGSSRFKIGRAVPVKFRLEGASAGITNLDARLTVTRISDVARGAVDCEGDEDGEDTDMLFKYRKGKGIYGYRWKTRGEAPGTYRLRADLGDGVPHEVTISLKVPR
jgi:hypothetical protein